MRASTAPHRPASGLGRAFGCGRWKWETSFAYGIGIRGGQRGKGYASEAVTPVLSDEVQERRYQMVTVSVFDCNGASVRLHGTLGFQREGRLPRTVFTRGRSCDEFVFGLTAKGLAASHGRAGGAVRGQLAGSTSV